MCPIQLNHVIVQGADLIKDVPENRWLIDDYYDPDQNKEDSVYCKRGSFIGDVLFDALEFGIAPTNIELTDTTQLLALIAAKQVLQDIAGKSYSGVDLSRASVILGVTSAQELLVSMSARIQRPVWLKALLNMGITPDEAERICQSIANQYQPWREQTFPGLLGNVVAGRIANRFDFGGTNCITDAACASSFSAISMGINELLLNQADLVVTGGADTLNDIFMYMCFGKTTALSRSGICRPFDEHSDGTLLGEGICLFALKRMDDAIKHGNKIYAVIKGVGKSSDGRSKSIYAPLAKGQEVALRRAYEEAGYSPNTVELVEAHGTGTKAGDFEEFKALNRVFSDASSAKNSCALGSIKSQIGHTKAAAGAFGLFKIVMGLHSKILPPTINIQRANSVLNIEKSPFYLSIRARPWIKSASEQPRRASVSSFGFGGTDFHITVEECSIEYSSHKRTRAFRQELLLLGGKSREEIATKLQELSHIDAKNLAYHAKVSQLAFDPAEKCRFAIVLDYSELISNKILVVIEKLLSKKEEDLPRLGAYFAEQMVHGKVALLFAGQNSQRLYMGDELAMHFKQARGVWEEVDSLKLDANLRLRDVVFPTPSTEAEIQAQYNLRLNQSSWTQSAIAAHAMSQFCILKSLGIKSDFMIGHSFGEFIALAAAGLMDVSDLVRLGWNRGRIIEEYAPANGAMLAVMHPINDLERILNSWDISVTISNKNSLNQAVISGSREHIYQLSERLAKENIASVMLKTPYAMHTSALSAAARQFREYSSSIKTSDLQESVLTNIDARPFPTDRILQLDYFAS